jgi:hypothetical protein
MEVLNNINWNVLAREVQSSLSNRFRKVWVNYTKLGSIQFTLFPNNAHASYEIVTRTRFVDVNKNIFAHARGYDSTLSFSSPPTDEDALRATEIVTSELAKVFVNEINLDLPPAP